MPVHYVGLEKYMVGGNEEWGLDFGWVILVWIVWPLRCSSLIFFVVSLVRYFRFVAWVIWSGSIDSQSIFSA